ncbi:MAG TPA: hypothetical protein VKD72_09640, partial [Gemmataceae bacterium]|nr:hypothetical protein [Gemmataceae bacterium]
MNSTTQQPKYRSLQLKLAVAGAILVVVLVAIYFRLSSDIDDGREVNDSGGVEKPLERARNILQKDADLASCRSALQQVNAHLTEPDAKQPPTLSASQTAALRRQLELDEGELKELNIQRFTRLDAHHLELCLLLRDAVRALELRSRSGRVAPQVEAAAALGWVVRQVRPRAGEEQEPQPQLVLRRGFGSPLARALLFIGLLEQLGHDGCLLALPGGSNAAPRYWACGVLGEKGQIYLFDPRLG